MLLLDASGRRLRRAIGFVAQYRAESDALREPLELAEAVGTHEIELDEDDESEPE